MHVLELLLPTDYHNTHTVYTERERDYACTGVVYVHIRPGATIYVLRSNWYNTRACLSVEAKLRKLFRKLEKIAAPWNEYTRYVGVEQW